MAAGIEDSTRKKGKYGKHNKGRKKMCSQIERSNNLQQKREEAKKKINKEKIP